jgi:uncharacterized protein (DUF952 family)
VAVVYKVLTPPEWEDAKTMGVFMGSAADIRDGFIHFSTAGQAEETVARHFSGSGELVLAAVDSDALGAALRWETSRAGALFPHLHGLLRASDVLWAETFDARRPGELRILLAR